MPAGLRVARGRALTANGGADSPELATPKPTGARGTYQLPPVRSWPPDWLLAGSNPEGELHGPQELGASRNPPTRLPRDWQVLARYHPPGWHLESNPRLFSPDGSSRQATCDSTGRALPDGTAIATDHAGRKASRPSGAPEEATMDWMSAMSVAVIIVVAAEAVGALVTGR